MEKIRRSELARAHQHAHSGGRLSHRFVGKLRERHVQLRPQFFLAIDPSTLSAPSLLADPRAPDATDRLIDGILESVHAAAPIEPGTPARYPGEQTLHLREENLRLGIPVDPELWQEMTRFA